MGAVREVSDVASCAARAGVQSAELELVRLWYGTLRRERRGYGSMRQATGFRQRADSEREGDGRHLGVGGDGDVKGAGQVLQKAMIAAVGGERWGCWTGTWRGLL